MPRTASDWAGQRGMHPGVNELRVWGMQRDGRSWCQTFLQKGSAKSLLIQI